MLRPTLRIALLSCLMAALAVSAFADKMVLGKLGQAIEATKIFARPATSSRVYYRCKSYEYLVINSSPNPKFLRVLLANGGTGYVPTDSVARLPYDVTQEAPSRDTGSMTSRSRSALANYSLKFQGTPYKWGGNDPTRGIDCSGFVKFLYGQIGVSLPRTAAEQVRVGKAVTRLEDLQPGDRLYFWSNKRNKVGHTGMYLGNGYFVHSSTNHNGVSTDDLRKQHWRNMLVAARR